MTFLAPTVIQYDGVIMWQCFSSVAPAQQNYFVDAGIGADNLTTLFRPFTELWLIAHSGGQHHIGKPVGEGRQSAHHRRYNIQKGRLL